MNEQLNYRNWFALYTHSRCEFKVNELLKSKNIITYLPIKKVIRKWSDRKKELELPLFNGYIFINATEKERLTALQQKHIVRCISDAGKPAIVPEWQIESLKKITSVDLDIEIYNGLKKGKVIEISTGPFKGLRGILVDVDNKKQLAVSIELLNRTVIVHLANEFVVALNH